MNRSLTLLLVLFAMAWGFKKVCSMEICNKGILEQLFNDIVVNGNIDNEMIQKYYHPDYIQIVDDKTLNLEDFVDHMKALHQEVAKLEINFEHMIAEGDKISTVHHARAIKKNGTCVRVKVIALFQFCDGRLILCNELTRLVQGDKNDKDLGSRTHHKENHETIDTQQKLMELSSGYVLSRAIHVAARMKIADCLIDGPCSSNEIAEKIGANRDALYRLLRLLVSYGIFHEDENKNFSLTPLARPMISGSPDSLHTWLAYHEGDEKRWRSFGHMEQTIRTGIPAFDHVFGKRYFDFIAQDKSIAQDFDEGMHNLSAHENKQIAACYDFSGAQTIVDVGGGQGGLLVEILKKNLSARGIVYDLPHVMPSAESYLAQQDMSSRVECRSGSFFDVVPQGADMYILKRVLHDWDDQACVTILKNCEQAMRPDSRLLILEAVVADGNVRDFIKDVDVELMVLFGGKERIKAEWEILLDATGLRLVKIEKTPSMLSIIEVARR